MACSGRSSAWAAFDSVRSHVVQMTVYGVEQAGADALVRVTRRDTLNGSIVNSSQQSFRMAKDGKGWTIVEIGR